MSHVSEREIILKEMLKTVCQFALYCLVIHMLILLFQLSHYLQLGDQSEKEILSYLWQSDWNKKCQWSELLFMAILIIGGVLDGMDNF